MGLIILHCDGLRKRAAQKEEILQVSLHSQREPFAKSSDFSKFKQHICHSNEGRPDFSDFAGLVGGLSVSQTAADPLGVSLRHNRLWCLQRMILKGENIQWAVVVWWKMSC